MIDEVSVAQAAVNNRVSPTISPGIQSMILPAGQDFILGERVLPSLNGKEAIGTFYSGSSE